MNSKLKAFLFLGAFVVLIGVAVFVYNTLKDEAVPQNSINVTDEKGDVAEGDSQNSESHEIGAPDFVLIDAFGKEVKLSDMFGKPIVLNFWASWCPPCKSEMPEFDKVYRELGSDIVFMMVDMTDGRRETMETGANYISSQGFSFSVYYDTNQEGAYKYGVRSIPTTVFIDKDGNIIASAQGAIDEATLRKGIDMIK